MAPKKGIKKKAAIKAVSTDADVLNNGEKELTEEFATDAKKLPNGKSFANSDIAMETSNLKGQKRTSGRSKIVAPDLEAEGNLGKKPASNSRSKKASSESEVIKAENSILPESQEIHSMVNEVKNKPKGKSIDKKTESKAKKTAKSKDNKEVPTSENTQEENANIVEEIKVAVKNTKGGRSRKSKEEILLKTEEEFETQQEIKVVEEQTTKKNSKKSNKEVEAAVEIEPPKRKGRAKKEKLVELDQIELAADDEIKVAVKEKKTAKRARAIAKAVTSYEEIQELNGDTEEVLPKKRSRKSASAEKEMVKEKPKKGRSKKSNKEENKIVKDSDVKEIDEEDNPTNGQIKQEHTEEKKESPSSNKKAGKQTDAVAPALTATIKAKGGRKRAAPSNANKKTIKAAANDGEELDDGVGNTELEDEADGSKSSKTKKAKTDAVLVNTTATKYNIEDFDLPPLNDGETAEEPRFNLKISSWNVAGLRAWVKKDGLKFLEYEQPDIFCMQETKCTNDQLPEEVVRIPGYHPYWLCMPGGHAGVAIYSKIMPINVDYGIGNKEFDDCGRIITAEYEKFFLINAYVPNSGRKLVNLEARMKWEKLFQQFIKNLDARKPVIICGDMNVSHQEHDLANPKSNTRNAGFTKEERDKMTELLALGYVDTFRHLYPERKGAYTYWTYMANARSRNVGWRLDYFIVSERFIKRVVDNCIRSQCLGSDHCPITLFLKL